MNTSNLPYLLLVDDELDGPLLIQEYVESLFFCHVAVSIKEAEKLVTEYNYSAIAINIDSSTETSRIDLMMTLREMKKYKSIPIIVVAGYSYTEDIQYLKELGFSNVLIKPYGKNELLETLHSHLIIN